MPIKTTTAPPEMVETIRQMAIEGKSGRVIALHIGIDHRRVSRIIRDILMIVRPAKKKTAKQSEALARPVASTRWEEMRRAERIVPTVIPHLNSTMRGTYEPKELSYRGQVR